MPGADIAELAVVLADFCGGGDEASPRGLEDMHGNLGIRSNKRSVGPFLPLFVALSISKLILYRL